jgi:ribosomal protein S18 acetylase RimI-like enzyme
MITNNNIEIKPVKEEDLIFINTTRNIFTTRKFLENNKKISLKDTIVWFNKKKPKWYIILFNNKKVGYIRTSDDTGKSVCIGCDIHPRYRRMGIAKKSYLMFIKYLYNKNYVNIWLEVFKYNTPAFNLYKKLNFVVISYRNVRQMPYYLMVHKRKQIERKN